MKISRRDFLKGSATTLFLAGFNLPALATTSKKKNLVVIMLRGGMDGLCAVPVIGDKNFEKRRKSILIENIDIKQIVVEFHPNLIKNGWAKTKNMIKTLNKSGYKCFGVSSSYSEFSFIKV